MFALAIVAIAFGVRTLLGPWTGKGAPFVLLFGAALVTTLVAGVGPGLLAFMLSVPIAALRFAVPAGATPREAAVQALLYGLDGAIVIYLTYAAQVARRRLLFANRELRDTAESLARSEAQSRQIIELSPDAYLRAELDGRFVDLNVAAGKLLGYARDELVGKSILDTWTHLAAVGDGTNISLFVNGSPVVLYEGGISGTPWSPRPGTFSSNSYEVEIGNWNPGNVSGVFYGAIDVVRIYARAKTTQEICGDANRTWSNGTCS